ncbi:MAG: hypothetical protein LC781_17660, partial [Actinobacteria bacterium]|nr:hypothetical protein [Actinomycetota bacterium]
SELRVELRKAKERLRHSQGCHPWLCQAAGFRGLDVHADINSTILAVLVAVLSVVLPPIQPDQLRALPIVVVVLLVISAVLFFLIVPRGARSNRPAVGGLVCSILGLLLLPVFWSGLPIVLGTAGVLLGRMARTTGRGLALAAIIIGIAAFALNLLGLLADRLLA